MMKKTLVSAAIAIGLAAGNVCEGKFSFGKSSEFGSNAGYCFGVGALQQLGAAGTGAATMTAAFRRNVKLIEANNLFSKEELAQIEAELAAAEKLRLILSLAGAAQRAKLEKLSLPENAGISKTVALEKRAIGAVRSMKELLADRVQKLEASGKELWVDVPDQASNAKLTAAKIAAEQAAAALKRRIEQNTTAICTLTTPIEVFAVPTSKVDDAEIAASKELVLTVEAARKLAEIARELEQRNKDLDAHRTTN
jgi:hypothetical protein